MRPFVLIAAVLTMFGSWVALSSDAKLIIANLPQLWFSGMIERDIPFGNHGLLLDIYRPSEGTAPGSMVVFFHGGSWQHGSKDQYAFFGMTLAERGHVVVIPDYRKYPDVRFPAFMTDASEALVWAWNNNAAAGAGPERIFVVGHSAGGHMAALLAADARYLADGPAVTLAGAVGLAGPYHFFPDEPEMKEIFGPPDRYPQMQVTTFVDGDEPPMLLLWGEDDDTVGRENLDRLLSALVATDACHRMRTYPGVDHVSIIGAFTWLFRNENPVVEDVAGFIANARSGQGCPFG